MAVAETAELITRLSLQDMMSAGLNNVRTGLQNAQGAVQRVQGHLGGLSGVARGVGGAFQHAAGRVGTLTKILGVGGLTGGIIGVVGILKSAIGEAREFGNTAEDMSSTLNISRGNAQLLLFTFKQFGIEADTAQKIVGMLEKNVGNLSIAGKSGEFLQKFGFNIQDSTGKVKDANTLIADFTDYWNDKTIPAEQKIAAGAQLFGHQWQGMLEVLQSGSGAWRDATQTARDLGLANENLTAQAEANEQAMFKWNTVVDALKITIGTEFLPILTDLAEQATRFVRDHRSDISRWFAQVRVFAKDAVQFITGSVLPMIGDLAGKAKGFWDSIPDPLRDLLVKGFVADRTVKFLFGFSLTDLAKPVLGGLADIFAKQFFMRGSTPANPLFVLDTAKSLGGGPGGLGGAGAAGGLGAIGMLGAVTTIVAAATAVVDQVGRLPTLLAGVQAAGSVKSAADMKAVLTQIFEGSTVAQPWRAFLPDFLNILGLNKPPDNRPILGPPAPPVTPERGGYVAERAGIQQRSVPPTALSANTMQQLGRYVADESKQNNPSLANLIGVSVDDRLGGKFAAFSAGFATRWGALRDQFHAQFGQGAQLRHMLAEKLGISPGKLDHLTRVMRGEVAKELGISVAELRKIKRGADHNEELIAAKLGISVEQLRAIRDRARETASGIVKLNNKDFSPNVTVKVTTQITTRDVTRSVSMNARYGKFAT